MIKDLEKFLIYRLGQIGYQIHDLIFYKREYVDYDTSFEDLFTVMKHTPVVYDHGFILLYDFGVSETIKWTQEGRNINEFCKNRILRTYSLFLS